MVAGGEETRRELVAAGLGRVAEPLASAVEGGVRMRAEAAEDAHILVGSSKMGGRPDMSPDAAWPRWNRGPLSFICQLNLDDVQAFACCQALPRTGRLLFFYDSVQQRWGFDPNDRESFSVIYTRSPEASLRRRNWPDDLVQEARFDPCSLTLCEVLTLPPWESILVEQLQLTEEEADRYAAVVEALESEEGEEGRHQLLGHPSPIQQEMQLECQLAANGIYVGDQLGYADPRRKRLEPGALEWRLLLQLDSEQQARMTWGDLGRLYFWIREADLRGQQFHEAWVILQSG